MLVSSLCKLPYFELVQVRHRARACLAAAAAAAWAEAP
jgi:hypothetical protein